MDDVKTAEKLNSEVEMLTKIAKGNIKKDRRLSENGKLN